MKDVIYHNSTEKEALEYTSKVVDFGLALVISSALNELLTAHNMLRQSKYFRHTVKARSNEALRLRNNKITELSNLVMHKGYSETYWDSVIDACEKDIDNLRRAIEEVLNDAGVPDAKIYCQVEVARILLESAVIHFKEIMRDTTNKYLSKNLKEMMKLNLANVFCEFNIDNIFKEWNKMCDSFYIIEQAKVDLNDSRVSDALDIVLNKFAKGEYIDECYNVANSQYPEFGNAKIIKE